MKQKNKQFAEILDVATMEAKAIEQLSARDEITLSEAYLIQNEVIKKREMRGEKVSGVKLGFTSKAKMEQMGVHDLIWGKLTNAMEIKNEGILYFNNYIHPRAEPEIAYLIKEDIKRQLNKEEALDFVDGIAPAIEIIDSRYKNFKFSLEDVVADNCSSTGYIIGKWMQPNTNVSNLELTLSVNNTVVESGNTNAILGDPLESFIEATRLAQQYDMKLKKGMIVLVGAATPASFIKKKDIVEASFKKLGRVTFKIQ